jgi:hypothetical protein
MSESISGGCACGAVRYTADAPMLMMNCHCRDCQRATGAGYAPFAISTRASVTITGGLHYRDTSGGSGKGVRRGFCPACGSPVMIEVGVALNVVGFYAASLDHPSGFAPTMDIFTDSAQPWVRLSDETEKRPRGPR